MEEVICRGWYLITMFLWAGGVSSSWWWWWWWFCFFKGDGGQEGDNAVEKDMEDTGEESGERESKKSKTEGGSGRQAVAFFGTCFRSAVPFNCCTLLRCGLCADLWIPFWYAGMSFVPQDRSSCGCVVCLITQKKQMWKSSWIA